MSKCYKWWLSLTKKADSKFIVVIVLKLKLIELLYSINKSNKLLFSGYNSNDCL